MIYLVINVLFPELSTPLRTISESGTAPGNFSIGRFIF